ncbi:hypothetical protein OG215_42000 (plasmid) [Streptomyces globisporus]|uniref:hypothetical protein n=1 Tax=Streptomyces globisporus TaxID=1908 RepID=UPI002F91580E|nr:hypothetical protein OG215_42000 [Streptomyces globisporus]
MCPPHLVTRRQLRDLGLRPGGHDPVAVLRCRSCAYRPGPARTLFHLGPYTQTGHAYQDADRITAALRARPAGRTITATTAPYEPNRHRQYADPYVIGLDALLAEAVV